ncbi:MAG: glycosyltransferase [Gammaproteobacteria bacterium]
MRGSQARVAADNGVAVVRILYLVDDFPSLTQTFVLNQITGMIDRGHDVDIYARRQPELPKVHTVIDEYDLLARTRYAQRVPRSRLRRALTVMSLLAGNGAWRRPAVLARAVNVMRYRREAASLKLLYSALPVLDLGRYDVIHCQFAVLGPTALRLRQIEALSGKLVTSIRGYDVTKYLHGKTGVYDELFAEADLFLPVSDSLRQRLLELGCSEHKIRVLHSGIDCDSFAYQPRRRGANEPTHIVTVGRLVEKKGIRYGVEAVARVLDSGRAVRYTVVGEGELRADLERLIDDLGVANHVHLAGWQDQHGVRRALENAHFVAAPSVTAGDSDQEGIPNALKEAMSMGLPVLGTWHSGIPELVEDGVSGFLVPERDAGGLAEKMMHLHDHPEFWNDMGRAGRARVEQMFDIGQLNDALVSFYQE